MKKIIISFLLLLIPVVGFAQVQSVDDFTEPEIFKARVIKVLDEKVKDTNSGVHITQQNLVLEGLSEDWKSVEFIIENINDLEVLNFPQYKVGNKVLVYHSIGFEGEDNYVIVDTVRSGPLLLLLLLFIGLLILIGKYKGFRSLLSLALSIFIVIYFIVPKIFIGYDPIFITIIGSLLITPLIIYTTEGFNKKSHLAVISIYISLAVTIILANLFVNLSGLTGAGSEEAMFLVGNSGLIDFKGLLLAGIIIGSLGVLDDLVISQISVVEEIYKVDNNLSKSELYKRASRVGVSHLGSMTNTLFLAYIGVFLPLFLLFYIKQPPFMTVSQVINSELIATEIIRTLVGSIGLVLAMPISTYLAVKFIKK